MFFRLLKVLKINMLYYYLISRLFYRKSNNTGKVDEAKCRLANLRKDVDESCMLNKKLVFPNEYDLDIIVPAYNADTTIESCIGSVLSQKTKYSFRVIIVNDGSKDNTSSKLQNYEMDDRVLIIEQDNGGISSARNLGLINLRSKYVTFLDSDDMLCDKFVDILLDKAYLEDADIVEGAYIQLNQSGSEKKYVSHDEGIMNGWWQLYGFPWGKLYKSTLFSNTRFPLLYNFEDSYCKQIIYPQAKKVVGIKDFVYKYRINQNGSSHTLLKKYDVIDSLWITMKMYEERCGLRLKMDEHYYEYMLKMAVLSLRRARFLETQVQKDIFVVFSDFLNRNFKDFTAKDNYLQEIEKSIRTCNFKRFRLCTLCY